MRPIGNEFLLEDRFDSIYRRNLIEPDAPTLGERKRQRKLKYKMANRLMTKAEEMHIETAALKKRNDEAMKGIKQLVKQDVIVI